MIPATESTQTAEPPFLSIAIMSAPVCLRSAFGACRPSKSPHLSIRAVVTQRRPYADKSSQKIQGIPETTSAKEQKKLLDGIPEKEPPKRTNPTVAASTPITKPRPQLTPTSTTSPSSIIASSDTTSEPETPQRPIPANVIAAYRAPLKHQAPYGVPVASLQLRSYTVRSLEFFSDFALRAAYYLNLPARGPVPLPKRIERWTMPRSNFVHKKAQENFERITMRRLITIMDGDKSAVEVWLAVLRKWQFYGVGMKANVWEWEGLDISSKMDKQTKDLEADLEAKLANFGWNKAVADARSLDEMLYKQGARQVGVAMTEVREGSRGATTEI